MEKKEIEALDLSKVVNVENMIIKPGHVLIKVVEKARSGLVLPANVRNEATARMEIVKVGSAVKDYKAGDIIIDIQTNNMEYMFKGDDRYMVCDVYNIILAVNPDNYSYE